jgi:glycosyltransferase involved in cell wall biosynthesis
MQFLPAFEYNGSTLLFFVFALIALIQLLFVIFIHGRLAFFKDQVNDADKNLPPLSIIIIARNESDNLYEYLPSILDQNYPEFEVIVINHQSTDDSAFLLAAFAKQYNNLKIIEVAKSQHLKPGKKLAITVGIKGAKYEHILLTDADCKPNSSNWLNKMASKFLSGKEIVMGYSPYYKKRGFLNKTIRFDTAWIGINYLSMALARMPYMSVGRNLAYTKTVFKKVNGFKSHYAIPSGDDDLFIQEAAKKSNYCISIDEDSFTYSEPHSNWSGWIRQKSRHFSTSAHYNVFKKLMLGIYPLTMLILLISFVILMFDNEYRWITLSIFIFLIGIKWWIHGKCLLKLKEIGLLKFLPFWDIYYSILSPILFYTTEKKDANKW